MKPAQPPIRPVGLPSPIQRMPRRRRRRRGRRSILVGAGCAVLLAVWGIGARATVPGDLDAVGSGALMFVTPGEERRRATRLATDVDIAVSGLLAQVTVTQNFRNDGDNWTEGIYVFPLPEKAAVNRLRMHIGERVIAGEIQPREQARKTYEKARASGKKASLVEQERPNLFTTSVANIGPGQSVKVEITYRERLRYDAGSFHLRFPLTLTPRYMPGRPVPLDASLQVDTATGWAVPTRAVPDAHRISPRMRTPDKPPSNPVTLDVSLDPGFELATLESPSHSIAVEDRADGTHRVRLHREHSRSDRDFVLRWRPRPSQQPRAAVFSETVAGERYAQVLLLPPQADRARSLRREVIFVIDTSGSMSGASIRQARRALANALGRLKPRDRFNIVAFNNQARWLKPGLQPAVEGAVADAQRQVRQLNAGGGTNILAALQLALGAGAGEGYLRQVVFMTDGAVGNEDQLFQYINDHLGDTRLFTVGIGSAPNSHFMRKAAQFGRGSFTYVGRVDAIEAKVGGLFRKLERAMVRDLQVDWPGRVEVYPDRVPDLYAGEPLVLAARLLDPMDAVTIEGVTGERAWRRELSLETGRDNPGVAVLWAREKVAALIDQIRAGTPRAEVRERVVETAMTHELVTKFTSLVAVDKTPSRPEDEGLEREGVPNNLPRGAKPEGFTASVPQTATPATRHLLYGTAALLLALLVSWIGRRREVRA